MADKKKSGVSVMPSFVDGEQPSAHKFSSIGSQVLYSNYIIEKSIGDIWGESYPYSTISNGRLSQPLLQGSGFQVVGGESGRRLDIASLARLIGPAGNLNPLEIGFTASGGFVEKVITEEVPAGVNQFTLKYSGGAHTFTDGNVFANEISSPNSISSAGDYQIINQVVSCFSTTSSTSNTVSYVVAPAKLGNMSSYFGSSFNTIPDRNQMLNPNADKLTITGPDSNGRYLVNLPRVIDQQFSEANPLQTNLDTALDINSGLDIVLPVAITYICGGDYVGPNDGIAGTVIPEGMLYLRNNATEELYTGAVYYYNTRNSFHVSGVLLDLSQEYSAITVGTNITSSIMDMRDKLKNHSHDGTLGEGRIRVQDLVDNLEKAGESGVFVPSKVESNHFPQYLHRDGSRGSDNGANDDNAMRGDLVIGLLNGSPGNYTGSGTTYNLRLGGGSSTCLIRRSATPGTDVMRIMNTTSSGSGILIESNDITQSNQERFFVNSEERNRIKSTTEYNLLEGKTNILDGGIVTHHENTGLVIESSSTPAENQWYHPRINTVAYRMDNERVYGVGDNGSRETTRDANNGLELEIALPTELQHPNSYIWSVDIAYSPGTGSYFTNHSNGANWTPSAPDSNWYFGNHYPSHMWRLARETFHNTKVAPIMNYHYSGVTGKLYLSWVLDNDLAAGAPGNVVLQASDMTQDSNNEWYMAMDIRILLRYTRGW